MLKNWKLLNSKMAFDHRWFKVRQDTVELPNGRILDDYLVSLGGTIVLIVPVTRDGKWLLVKQYKHAAGQVMLEFPAGYVDKQEDVTRAAKRELLEETGYESKEYSLLATLTNNPTKEAGEIHIYLARGAERVAEPKLDDTEEIEIEFATPQKVDDLIARGDIWVSASIAAAHLAFRRLGI